jgi:HK97 gp10 family phage protein
VFKFQLEGASEFAKMLEALPARASKQVQRDILEQAAEPMRQDMAQTVAYEPGKPDLRDAMVTAPARGEDANETAVAVGPHKGWPYYGSFVEFGTAHMAAQPFARPAFDRNVRGSLEIMGDEIWFALKHGIDRF